MKMIKSAKITNKNYIGELDFLKFLMALVIMTMHVSQRNQSKAVLFGNGGFAVEFFFVVSGYFMCVSAARSQAPTEQLGMETMGFLWKKFKQIWFPYVFLYAASIVLYFFTDGKPLLEAGAYKEIVRTVLMWIPNFLLLNTSGILHDKYLIKIAWYVSGMFLGMLIIYPLLRKYGQNFRLLFAPAFTILGTGYAYIATGVYKNGTETLLFLFSGSMFRSLLGLCLGCMVYEFGSCLRDKEFSKTGKGVLSICGMILAAILFYVFWYKDAGLGFVVLPVLFFLVSIIVSKQGLFAGIFDNNLCRLLGRASMYWYFLHILMRNITYKFWPAMSLKKALLLVTVSTALLVAAVMAIDDYVMKRIKNHDSCSDSHF